MNDGVFFINTARGPIVDEQALIAALESGKAKRAGLDVFECEPRTNRYFRESGKVILQPHIGGLMDKAKRDAERECLENVKAYLISGRLIGPVNEIQHLN